MSVDADASVLTYANISLGGKDGGLMGVMKMNKSGIAWKSKGGKTVSVYGAEITGAEWFRTGRNYQLKLKLQAGTSTKFDGFKEQDFTALAECLKTNFRADVKQLELDTKGINRGQVEIQGNMLLFTVDNKQMFEVPVTDVSQCVLPAKNELALEFHNDDTSNLENDTLVEMRFFFPTDKEEEQSLANAFHEQILEKADISTAVGGGIVSFDQMLALTPRGRYDIEMFASFMKLHGKTYDYKILYSSISRLYQLPKVDGRHVAFVISLDPPIRQGQTRYPHLVLQFSKEEEIELDVNLAEEVLQDKYGGKLEKKLSGPLYTVVCQVFKALTTKKITIPGSFKSHAGGSAIKCSMKASEGWLYPLEHSFFFIYKPATHIRFEEIGSVQFARVSSDGASSNRTFDLIVNLKSGSNVQFTSIQRQEYSTLFNFITSKKLKIVTPEGSTVMELDDAMEERASTKELPYPRAAEDEEDEEDEDFVAKEEDDVPEEFDSGGEDEDGDADGDDGDADGASEDEGGKRKSKEKSKEKDSDTKEKDKASHKRKASPPPKDNKKPKNTD
jgi:structure-specific recognition protein 1